MVCQSDKALATVFYVPNDKSGREFIKSLHFYLNRKCHRIRLRGRNEDRKQLKKLGRWNTREFVPKGMSSYFAVYIDSPAIEKITGEQNRKLYQQLSDAQAALRLLPKNDSTITKDLDTTLESLLQFYGRRKIRLE